MPHSDHASFPLYKTSNPDGETKERPNLQGYCERGQLKSQASKDGVWRTESRAKDAQPTRLDVSGPHSSRGNSKALVKGGGQVGGFIKG